MKKITILTLAALCATGVYAQNHPAKMNESKEIHTIGFTPADSLAVYRAFVENAPKRFQIAGAPRFAIVGKNEKFYLGIGGSAKGIVGFDFPNPVSSEMYFTTSTITKAPAGSGGHLWINAQQSYLYFNAVAFPGTENQLGFYFNFDLCNSSYTPMIQNAYLTYRGMLFGYNTSLFYDGNACGPGIDKEGPNSLTWALNTVLDYIHSFKNGLTLAVGAEIGTYSYTTNAYTAQVSQRVPDFPLYVQYNFKNNPNSYVRFSALFRGLQYRDLVNPAKNRTTGGWGIKASGTIPLGSLFQTYFQAGYGKGITGYFEDLNGMNLDLVPSTTENGKLDAVPAWGGYFGLQYNINNNWYASVCYSHLRNYAKNYGTAHSPTVAWDTQYSYAQYMDLNLFYNINSMLTWGIEWDWGRRVNFDHNSVHDNRIQTMVQFTF